ncbi:hypothetical protein OSH11_14375 [Kaistia dalseonensis]|uniref:Uncharacterized protein n=1 Tax=Kaistia dalseonensis TaxID=410840 RepID=A0ABU0H861_9HYPH|nr:hypothetical protein [Kaistia dalseonensis]MCX5495896.1 hypothetical protein [Kaistia dalseonensis]MDQ0438498.1 hypothetical protein [Kaistia dalseonensis]
MMMIARAVAQTEWLAGHPSPLAAFDKGRNDTGERPAYGLALDRPEQPSPLVAGTEREERGQS